MFTECEFWGHPSMQFFFQLRTHLYGFGEIELNFRFCSYGLLITDNQRILFYGHVLVFWWWLIVGSSLSSAAIICCLANSNP